MAIEDQDEIGDFDELVDDTVLQDADGDTDGDSDTSVEPVAVVVPKRLTSRRARITAVELEQRFDQWSAQRQAKADARTPQSFELSRRRLLIGGLCVATAATLIGSSVLRSQTDNQIAKLAQENAELVRQVGVAQADANPVNSKETLTALMTTANTAATGVAETQQGFAVLYQQASEQPSHADGTPNQAMLSVGDHRRKMALYFSPKTYLVADAEAYQWTTAYSFNVVTQLDPRYEWFIKFDGDKAAVAQTYTWAVSSVMADVDGSTITTSRPITTATVVWTCADANGVVLAWASGTFNQNESMTTASGESTTGAFTSFSLVLTEAGAAVSSPSSQATPPSGVPDITDINGQEPPR